MITKLQIHPATSRTDPSLFQDSYQSDGQTFTAKAVGDAGCRGEIVTYTMTGKAIHGNPVVEFTEPR